MIDIRHLRYFVGIADSGSMMKASERLHVAQPALSVHISNLEATFGVQLLQRTNRGVTLTEDGKHFYRHAMIVIQNYHEMISSLRDRSEKPSGNVSVGFPSTTSPEIAVDLFRRVRDTLPDVTLYVTDASTATLYEWLIDGRLDFSVLFSLPEEVGLDVTPLKSEEFCLVTRTDCTDPEPTIDFEDLFRLPLVVSCKSTTWRKILDDEAEKRGFEFKTPIETESFSVIKSIILSGEASGILPRSCIENEVQRGIMRARRLVNPEIRGLLALACLRTMPMTPAKLAVRDLVVDLFKERQGDKDTESGLTELTPILRTVPSTVLPTIKPEKNSSRR